MPDGPRHLADAERGPWWRLLDRRRLSVAIGTTFLAMPFLVLDNLPARADSPEAVSTATSVVVTTTTATTAAPTTTTTAPPPTTAPPTTAPPTTAPPTTAPPTTAPPTTAPPTTVAQLQPAAPPAPVGNEERGKATFYWWNPGECAHKTLPKGTTVTITNVANGASTTCVVTDRGPYGAGRIIDLDSTVFDDIASLETGVIDVVITW